MSADFPAGRQVDGMAMPIRTSEGANLFKVVGSYQKTPGQTRSAILSADDPAVRYGFCVAHVRQNYSIGQFENILKFRQRLILHGQYLLKCSVFLTVRPNLEANPGLR